MVARLCTPRRAICTGNHLITRVAFQSNHMDMDAEEKEAAKAERMGLTPDWIIQVEHCPCTSLYECSLTIYC